MTNKPIMVSLIALFALVLTLATVAATEIVLKDDIKVQIDDIVVSENTNIAGIVSDKVPVEIEFTANDDAEDVRVSAFVEGYKNEIYYSTSRFRIVKGSKYVKRFVLELPNTFDLDDVDEILTLNVRISAKGRDSVESDVPIRVERELYSLNFLSVNTPSEVTAGDVLAVDVVLENNGFDRLDQVFVEVRIPELGLSQKVFADDVEPSEEISYDDIRNSVNKRVYLTIPKSATAGIYDLEVEAYNYDASVMTKKKIAVDEASAGIIPAGSAKRVAPGEEATFEVVLVNPNNRILVYSITPEEAKGLIVDITEPVVAVPADSSRTVKIKVEATDSAEEGTHILTVNVNSEAGTSEQVKFTVNVEKGGDDSRDRGTSSGVTGTPDTVVVLTVVLAIIFVVLLIVLIVLLTKRPQEDESEEEFGETSYY